jgi:hypothetical protein
MCEEGVQPNDITFICLAAAAAAMCAVVANFLLFHVFR